MDLLSHFFDSSTEGANPGEPSVNYRSKKDNPDLVSRSIINRYRNARANNMYGESKNSSETHKNDLFVYMKFSLTFQSLDLN